MKEIYQCKFIRGQSLPANVPSHSRNLLKVKLCLCSLLIIMAFAGNVLAQAPSIVNINASSSWTKIIQASGSGWMQFPWAYTFDEVSSGVTIKKNLVSWNTGGDVVEYPVPGGWSGSLNSGVTWNSPAPTNTPDTLDFTVTVKRKTDGVIITLPSYLGYTGADPFPPFRVSYLTSSDNGVTWTGHSNGVVTGFGSQDLAGFHFHRGIVQDNDGTLYAPAYANWRNTDGTYQSERVMLMKSTDGGVTWNYLSTIQYTSGIDYNETTIVRCKDNSILAIMRNASNSLKYQRSTNNGVSWGSVNFVPDLPTNEGVDPYLYMMPNGVLVLLYGDNVGTHLRNCYVAYSPDGNGTSWTNITNTFTTTSGLGNASSAYTSILPVRNNNFLQVSDRALYTYYGTDQHPTPNPFSLWTKSFDMVLNYRNRMDLLTKYNADSIAISTNLTLSSATFPQAGIKGPIDGSTDYWSGAYLNGTGGYYTVDLLRSYTNINAVGVCLLNSQAESAVVQYSTDNSTWTNIKIYTNAVHTTMDYTSISTPITARYIRVSGITSSADTIGLNELAIFTTADTFEDYALNVVPYGYTAANGGFWVSQGVTPLPTGYVSQRALYMDDSNSSTNTNITKTGFTAGAKKTFTFNLQVKAFAPTSGAVQWALLSGTTSVFQIGVFPGGGLNYYNGSWHALGSGTPVPLNTWKTIKVIANATSDTAYVYVNGVKIGNALKNGTATTINGFSFGSGGTAPVGDQALMDDIDLYDTPTTPDIVMDSFKTLNDTTKTAGKDSTLIKANTLDNLTNGKFAIMVSPNPANGVVKLSIKNQATGTISIFFTDISGRTVKKLSSDASTSSISIPIQGLMPGMYIITAMQNGQTAQTKLIVN